MRKHWKPILSLIILVPFLTELLSGNIPPTLFFTLPIIFFLVTIGYGFPLLVIREIAVRNNFGLIGLYVLGLIYGIYNEALLAKTVFYPFHAPVETFATYGLLGNIRIPWTLLMTSWHAFYAVIFPILIISYLFPHYAKESWMSKRTAWVLGLICLGLGTIIFFNPSPTNPVGGFGSFVVIIIASYVLWRVAKKTKETPSLIAKPDDSFNWKKMLGLGIVFNIILVFIPFVFAGVKVSALICSLYSIGWMVFFLRKAARIQHVSHTRMLFFALGAMICSSVLALPLNVAIGRGDQVIASILFVVIFIVAAIKLKSRLPARTPVND